MDGGRDDFACRRYHAARRGGLWGTIGKLRAEVRDSQSRRVIRVASLELANELAAGLNEREKEDRPRAKLVTSKDFEVVHSNYGRSWVGVVYLGRTGGRLARLVASTTDDELAREITEFLNRTGFPMVERFGGVLPPTVGSRRTR